MARTGFFPSIAKQFVMNQIDSLQWLCGHCLKEGHWQYFPLDDDIAQQHLALEHSLCAATESVEGSRTYAARRQRFIQPLRIFICGGHGSPLQ
jgi:hypothetical protein